MDAFIGEIKAFGFNYPPQGFMPCIGQTLPVVQYQVLYSVIGNLYGGTPGTNFMLPDLRGYVPMGYQSQGGGAQVGTKTGTATVALTSESQIPPHTHNIAAYNRVLTQYGTMTNTPSASTFLAAAATTDGTDANIIAYANAPSSTTDMSPYAIGVAGVGNAHNNMMPYLPLNFCICYEDGDYPVRP